MVHLSAVTESAPVSAMVRSIAGDQTVVSGAIDAVVVTFRRISGDYAPYPGRNAFLVGYLPTLVSALRSGALEI